MLLLPQPPDDSQGDLYVLFNSDRDWVKHKLWLARYCNYFEDNTIEYAMMCNDITEFSNDFAPYDIGSYPVISYEINKELSQYKLLVEDWDKEEPLKLFFFNRRKEDGFYDVMMYGFNDYCTKILGLTSYSSNTIVNL